MIDIEVKFFGLFKKYGSSVKLQVPSGITIEEFQNYFDTKISCGKKIISESVFANDDRILNLSDRLDSSCTLSVLPPVCGG